MLKNELKTDRRQAERFSTRLRSVALINEKICTGIVDNFSKGGLAYRTDDHALAVKILESRDKALRMIVTNPIGGDTLNLTCEIIWGPETVNDNKGCMGIKVIDPPLSFRELFNNHIKM